MLKIHQPYFKFKTEEVTTSVFITALWKDYRLAWNPKDYNGLKESRIPGYLIVNITHKQLVQTSKH